VVVVVTVAVVAAASMAAAAAEVSTAVADLMGVGVPMMAARIPMAENVATKAAAIAVDLRRVVPERAAVRMAAVRMEQLELAAIPARREVTLRIFVPPSPMASGIRSVTAVPRIPV
jgi:hypothetical protein